MEQLLAILHLSDLHFAAPANKGHYWNSESTEFDLPPQDRKGFLGRLMEDPMLKKVPPSFVVVSGDLLDKADPDGVDLAFDFLRRLADETKIPRKHFVLVPGNHDVSRDPSGKYRYFDDVYARFYQGERPGLSGKAGHERAELFHYPEYGLTIAGFNSAEALPDANPHGSIGDVQRRTIEKQLAPIEESTVRIAVMHHHLEQPQYQVKRDVSVMNDPQTMKTWLRANHFSLVLHGHQHLDWQTTVEHDDWRLAVVAAGSAGVGSYGRKEWELPLCCQLIVLFSPWEGLRLRREYSARERRWGEASPGADGKNRPRQQLRLGSIHRGAGASAQDSRRFLPAFDLVLSLAPESARGLLAPHREAAEKGRRIDLCALCDALSEILDLVSARQRRDLAEAAKKLLCRVVLDVPISLNPAALPPIRLFSDELEAVPVATYLYLAILVARAQGVATVDLELDPKFGLVGADGLSPGHIAAAPTLKDGIFEFEKVLWEAIGADKAESYKKHPECDSSPVECREHRMLGDQPDRCNQNCCGYRLYSELEGRSARKRRPFIAVDTPRETWPAWSEVAASITSVSFLRLGGSGGSGRPPDESKVHHALKSFFEKADGTPGKRARR
jgi:predicted MPP superfamily phosphohydrolase